MLDSKSSEAYFYFQSFPLLFYCYGQVHFFSELSNFLGLS